MERRCGSREGVKRKREKKGWHSRSHIHSRKMRLTGQSVPRRCFHFSSIQICNHCPLHEPAPLHHTEKKKHSQGTNLQKKGGGLYVTRPQRPMNRNSNRLLSCSSSLFLLSSCDPFRPHSNSRICFKIKARGMGDEH